MDGLTVCAAARDQMELGKALSNQLVCRCVMVLVPLGLSGSDSDRTVPGTQIGGNFNLAALVGVEDEVSVLVVAVVDFTLNGITHEAAMSVRKQSR